MKKFYLLFLTILFVIPFKVSAYSKALVDITNMNIYEIQTAIDNGYLTYEELTRLYLERIESYDKDYNTIITLNNNAIEEAKKCDAIYKEKGRDSLLFGIPILVKDNIDVYGMPTTNGTKTLLDSYPKEDSEAIKLLKEKGVIVLGKTNMSEFAFYASSSKSSFGTTSNAYNKEYSSYGSSGGSAVSVALAFAQVSLGTDTAASVRTPASANNVIGIRPTFNTISSKGVILYDMTRDTIGVFSRNTYDNMLFLAVLQEKNEEYYTKLINNKKKHTILVINDFYKGYSYGSYETSKTDDKIVELMDSVLKKLDSNNIEVKYIDNFYKYPYNTYDYLTTNGKYMCTCFNEYIKGTTSNIRSLLELERDYGHINTISNYLAECGDIYTNNLYEHDKEVKNDYIEYIKEILKIYDADFLVYPTTKNLLIKNGDSTESFITNSSTIAPVAEVPSINLSLGSIEGLYYGMEVVALKNEEYMLYSFASLYEQINHTYKLPDEAPPLYETYEEVNKLSNLYNIIQTKNIIDKTQVLKQDEYKVAIDNIKDFFDNYNFLEEDEIITKAQTLYNEYIKSVNSVSFSTIYYCIANLTLLFILIILVKKKES